MSGKQTTQKDIVEAADERCLPPRSYDRGSRTGGGHAAIPEGGEIGEEVHPATDQLLLFVEGRGQAISRETFPVGPSDLVFVRAGTRHNFINTGGGSLRLITVYAPPSMLPDLPPHEGGRRRSRGLRSRASARGWGLWALAGLLT